MPRGLLLNLFLYLSTYQGHERPFSVYLKNLLQLGKSHLDFLLLGGFTDLIQMQADESQFFCRFRAKKAATTVLGNIKGCSSISSFGLHESIKFPSHLNRLVRIIWVCFNIC